MFNFVIVIFAVLFICGCKDQSPLRHYVEFKIENKTAALPDGHPPLTTQLPNSPSMDMGSMGNAEIATSNDSMKSSLSWTIPMGWVEGKPMPLRLASFVLKDDPSAFDCSIVALPGAAGGLEANLKRWLGQINIVPSDEQFADFMKQSKDGFYNFSFFQKSQNEQTPSMLAVIKEIDGVSIFIKFKTTLKGITLHKDEFNSFAQSVKKK